MTLSRARTRALAGWGAPLSDWMEALVVACEGSHSQAAVAQRLGITSSYLTQVLGRTYRGPYDRVEAAVRGAYMGETVICPVLGEIGRDRCRDEQRRPFAVTSSVRARLFRACHGGCPHYRGKEKA